MSLSSDALSGGGEGVITSGPSPATLPPAIAGYQSDGAGGAGGAGVHAGRHPNSNPNPNPNPNPSH